MQFTEFRRDPAGNFTDYLQATYDGVLKSRILKELLSSDPFDVGQYQSGRRQDVYDVFGITTHRWFEPNLVPLFDAHGSSFSRYHAG